MYNKNNSTSLNLLSDISAIFHGKFSFNQFWTPRMTPKHPPTLEIARRGPKELRDPFTREQPVIK